MSDAQLGLLIALLFPLAFGAIWCGVLLLLSHVSGWRRMAARFAADGPPAPGETFRWQSGSVGLVSYRNCLHVEVSRTGLSLAVPWLFRLGHRRLFFPWHAIHNREDTTFLWLDATRFEVGRPALGSIRLPRRVFVAAPETGRYGASDARIAGSARTARAGRGLAPLIVLLAVLLTGSGVVWFALSQPPAEHLPLPPGLLAISSPEGEQRLANSAAKADHAQLKPWLLPQIRRAFCGPASSAAVINAALAPSAPVTQSSLFTAEANAIKGEWATTFSGMTLQELAGILRAHGLQVDAVHADESSVAAFRDIAREALADTRSFLIVNYDRRALAQSGSGHISPLGAYSEETDSVLVLDVATYKYPYTWVPLAKLWDSMNTVDGSSGQTRGFLRVSAAVTPR